MGTKLLDRETCMSLGSQMFALVSAKVLLLEKKEGCLKEFIALLNREEVDDLFLLKDGFIAECIRHSVSRNEAEQLFARTMRYVEGITV
ncbi:hypothetical protein [Gorillibacterium massiliense]|uniref:hypothetical protein n=1 Tax=Gorillibacterium massiliense TaxID=1280390 RepID=UPI00059259E9|nr:hypothetical protein [Gorillibacterium massiliense]